MNKLSARFHQVLDGRPVDRDGPDFSNWKDHDGFELAFARLLKDFKAEESTEAKPV